MKKLLSETHEPEFLTACDPDNTPRTTEDLGFTDKNKPWILFAQASTLGVDADFTDGNRQDSFVGFEPWIPISWIKPWIPISWIVLCIDSGDTDATRPARQNPHCHMLTMVVGVLGTLVSVQ